MKGLRIVFSMTVAAMFLSNTLSPPVFSLNRSASPACAPVNMASGTEPDSSMRSRVSETYGKLPLRFEANRGQAGESVKFVSRGSGYTLFLSAAEAVMVLKQRAKRNDAMSSQSSSSVREPHIEEHRPAVLRMRLPGANPAPEIEGLDVLPGQSNYFIGDDPKAWRTGVPAYSKVRYRNVYPGTHLVFYGNQQNLEYDFILEPGADPRVIRIDFAGARRVRLDAQGNLALEVEGGRVYQQSPFIYQEVNGVRKEVQGRYVLKGRHRVGFEIGRYDRKKPLVIDPVLTYSTYFGGSGEELGLDISVDRFGNAYIVGQAFSLDPSMAAFVSDAFIVKLNPAGTALVYSTILGGNSQDAARGVAIDASGNAFVVGGTRSTNFPTLNPIQPTFGGGGIGSSSSPNGDAFVTKLSPTGSSLLYSTYLGGFGPDIALDVAIDTAGSAYVTGSTTSPDFPAANPIQPGFQGIISDAFITKINPSGTALVYSTFFGGTGGDFGNGIAVDPDGNAYVVGSTTSFDFPIHNSLFPGLAGRTAFKTVNGADDWNTIITGFPVQTAVNVIAIDPTNSATLYSATTIGVFKSTDSGASWNRSDTGLLGASSVRAIAVDPQNPSTVYAGTSSTVFKSTDGGASWSRNLNAFSPRSSRAIVIDPKTTSTLYAGSTLDGVRKSTDGGASWIGVNRNLNDFFVTSLVINPAAPAVLYASTGGGIHKTNSGGGIWGLVLFGFSGFVLAIDPVNPNVVYGGTSTGDIAKTTDDGANWDFIFDDPLNRAINTLVVDPVTPNIIYAGTRSGVLKSTDGGFNWIEANRGLASSVVNSLAIDPVSHMTLYAGTTAADDAFVTKLNSTGSAVVYSSYLGGSFNDLGRAIAVDEARNVYVAGLTGSFDFPTVNALQQNQRGPLDAFVCKLNAAGTSLIYSTYLGGSGGEFEISLTLGPGGRIYLAGVTSSNDFPVVDAVQMNLRGTIDAFVARINPSGNALEYSTYLGGGSFDQARSIAVDAMGNAYITGETTSDDFPVTPGAIQTTRVGNFNDAFISKIGGAVVFDICIEDDRNGSIFRFNSTNGEYEYINCRKAVIVRGSGIVTRNSCKINLRDISRDRNVSALANPCTREGAATLQVFSQGLSTGLSDSNITNNTCACR